MNREGADPLIYQTISLPLTAILQFLLRDTSMKSRCIIVDSIWKNTAGENSLCDVTADGDVQKVAT